MLEQAAPRIGSILQCLLAETTGLQEGALGIDEVLEAQDRGEGVVELRRPFIEEGAQLVVGEERSMGAQGRGPAQRREIGRRLAGELGGGLGGFERSPGLPPASYDARFPFP